MVVFDVISPFQSSTLQQVIAGVSNRLRSVSTQVQCTRDSPPEIFLFSEEGRIPTEQEASQYLHNAATLKEYQEWAEILDELQGHNEWKAQNDTGEPGFDPVSIEELINDLRYATATSDLGSLQYLLRTSLSRDFGSMNRQSMYKHSWSGTKDLTENYINSVLEAIDKLAHGAVQFKLHVSEVKFYQKSLEESLNYFGRSALALSGGAKMGMKHIGVVKSLWEADVLPDIISGASAGSIVAAVACASNDGDLEQTLEQFPYSDLACFDPPGTSGLGWWKERASTFMSTQTFFEMKNMEKVMKSWLGDLTFQEAYYKTGRILNISVSSASEEEPHLLNYITTPDVLIWSAVCASCSVPGLFPAAKIFEKDPITKEPKVWMQANNFYVDGSLDQDLPMRKISEMFNVNFFIVAQVNPHVRFFVDLLGQEKQFKGQNTRSDPTLPSFRSICWSALNELGDRSMIIVSHFEQFRFQGSVMRAASLLRQQYTGNINIFPKVDYLNEWLNMLSNPTPAYMLKATSDGERAAWPKIWRLKNCVAIELALIRAINVLKERVHFGPEARAMRDAERVSKRGRSHRIRGQRSNILRRRSLSQEHHTLNGLTFSTRQVSGPPTPSPTVRRNLSLSRLPALTSFTSIMRGQTPLLSPQIGVDHAMQNGVLEQAIYDAPAPNGIVQH